MQGPRHCPALFPRACFVSQPGHSVLEGQPTPQPFGILLPSISIAQIWSYAPWLVSFISASQTSILNDNFLPEWGSVGEPILGQR